MQVNTHTQTFSCISSADSPAEEIFDLLQSARAAWLTDLADMLLDLYGRASDAYADGRIDTMQRHISTANAVYSRAMADPYAH